MLQWLFRRKAESDRLQALLTDLTTRIEALERGQKGIRLEWEDAFTRLEKMIGRMTGALKRASAPESDETGAPRPEPGVHRVGSSDGLVRGTHEALNEMRQRRALLSR